MYEKRVARLHSVADFRNEARKRLPRMVFDYVDGAAGAETTAAENRAAIDRVRLVPAAPADTSNRSQKVTLFGRTMESPVIIGPTGLASAFWPKGELELARAADKHGIPFTASNSSAISVEEIRASGSGPKWQQIYLPRDRDLAKSWVERCTKAGIEVLELTIDSAVPGNRLRDTHNGFAMPFKWTPRKFINVAMHPEWALRMAPHGAPEPNMMVPQGRNLGKLNNHSEAVKFRLNDTMSWDYIAQVRDWWKGPLVIKGLVDPRQCGKLISVGIDGVVISNHGGRQLDGGVGTMDVLPDFAAALGDRVTILVNSGFRSGVDILKAMALGAKGVQIGRAPIYALGIAGQEGVDRLLTVLKGEIDNAMALVGINNLSELNRDFIRRVGHDWPRN